MLSLYIKGSNCFNYFDEKIIIVGGFNGEKGCGVKNFIQIVLGYDFTKDCYVEEIDRKLMDINKNKCYTFCGGFSEFNNNTNNNILNVCFDQNDYVHIINVSNLGHDIFYYN